MLNVAEIAQILLPSTLVRRVPALGTSSFLTFDRIAVAYSQDLEDRGESSKPSSVAINKMTYARFNTDVSNGGGIVRTRFASLSDLCRSRHDIGTPTAPRNKIRVCAELGSAP